MQDRRCEFDPWVGKSPWNRKWQPSPVFLPGKYHGWRSLVGYSPWGHKELDTTEQLHFHNKTKVKKNDLSICLHKFFLKIFIYKI